MEIKEKKRSSNLSFIDDKNETLGANRNFFQRTSQKLRNVATYSIPKKANNYKEWIFSFRGGLIIFVLIFMTVLMFFINTQEYYALFILAMIYSIFSASWDLLSGVTGQVSFGHAAFFGLGAYAIALLINLYTAVNLVLLMILAGVLTVIFGLIIAVPSLRFRGPYLALGTLAFSLILFYVCQQPEYIDWFKYNILPYEIDTLDLPLAIKIPYRGNLQMQLIFVLIVTVICITVLLIIYNSNLGKIFKGIRDDENAIKASGVNTWKYKLYAFMISAFFAGIAGALYCLHNGQATYFEFSTTLSFYPVIFACLGGIAQISGAVMGAFTFVFVRQIIQEIFPLIVDFIPFIDASQIIRYVDVLSLLIFAVILIIIIRFTERGVMEPLIKNSKTLWDLVSGK